MKRLKVWLIFNKDVPEKEWEAKYLSELHSQSNTYGLIVSGLLALLFLPLIFGLSTAECEIQMKGNYTGFIDVNTTSVFQFTTKVFDQFNVSNLNGEVKIRGSCLALSVFLNR